jgi:predicted KAP-like P-loop ATPase
MSEMPLNFSDIPTKKDEFGFSLYVSALEELINETAIVDTPITIGVFGAWGSGKTSLMSMLLERFDSPIPESNLVIWFDSWRYSQKEALWCIIIECCGGLKRKNIK